MPSDPEKIANCPFCGGAMNVSELSPFTNVQCPSCGEESRVKLQFGPYTLVRRHAIGGMSMVFAAHDPTLDREVALKILSEEYSADERRIAAFEEEARITASFSHPHVVRVLRTGKAFGHFYIAMELVSGGHFEHQIRQRGVIPELQMLPFAIEVAQGLKAANAAGLIHRDMKPGNILLDSEGHAKIVDFGLALVTQGGKAKATEIWATPYYVPPETIEGDIEDFRSDIYAFGATFYHALLGTPSCGEETMATEILREAKKRVVPLGQAAPWLSAETCRIIEKAMAYEPKDRFSSYDELISRLEYSLKRLTSEDPGAVETSGGAAKRRADQKRRKLRGYAAAGAALLGLIVAGSLFATRSKPRLEKPSVSIQEPISHPQADSSAASTVSTAYLEAKAALEARNYEKSSSLFMSLCENPEVQEPTRTWAGVEAVLSAYLSGQSPQARGIARQTAAHAESVPEPSLRMEDGLLRVLGKLSHLRAFSSLELDPAASGAPTVISWMLAGLKNWEQGALADAAEYFKAVSSAKLGPDDGWLEIYQNRSSEYLMDYELLTRDVFSKLPDHPAACLDAVATLERLLEQLKTQGRARFNVRAWQLDLRRQAKILESNPPAKPEPEPEPEPSQPIADLDAILERIRIFSRDCQFAEAAGYLTGISAGIHEDSRQSLIRLSEAAAVFLLDLEEDLMKSPVTAELMMKSGDMVGKVAFSENQEIQVTDSAGNVRSARWDEFSPDALIEIHRILVKSPGSELERLRRHECAISFGWLAGNRDRASAAAAQLCRESPSFKQRWESAQNGLARLPGSGDDLSDPK